MPIEILTPNNMQHSQNKSKDTLQELAQLDKKLAQLQTFFRSTKTGDVNDSLLTKHNVQEAIALLEKINPSEKNMIYALKSLLPLSEKTPQELSNLPDNLSKLNTNPTENYNQWTPKLKSKVPLNRVI